MNKRKYLYSGPVYEFEKCINLKWNAATFAVSEEKAKSNLMFQYKKEFGKVINSKITLPGKLVIAY